MKRSLFEARHGMVRRLQILNHVVFVVVVNEIGFNQVLWGGVLGYILFHLGHNMGAHRYFCHRQFQTNRLWELIFHFAFTLNVLGSAVGYQHIHRQHHRFSDKEKDPHCPRKRGWLRSYFLSDFATRRFFLPPNAMSESFKDPLARFFHRYYFLIIGSYIFVTIWSFEVFVAGYLVPALVAFHMSQFQIVFSHFKLPFSNQLNATDDFSFNHYILKPVFLGDELHNNHHARPTALDQNMTGSWREFDPIAWIVARCIAK